MGFAMVLKGLRGVLSGFTGILCAFKMAASRFKGSVKGRKSYEIQISVDPITATSWQNVLSETTFKTVRAVLI